jgi:hypothetical protein
MADIINNKADLMEVLREAAEAVFAAWKKLEEKEKEEQKRKNTPIKGKPRVIHEYDLPTDGREITVWCEVLSEEAAGTYNLDAVYEDDDVPTESGYMKLSRYGNRFKAPGVQYWTRKPKTRLLTVEDFTDDRGYVCDYEILSAKELVSDRPGEHVYRIEKASAWDVKEGKYWTRTGGTEERQDGETAIQYGERMIREFFKEDPQKNGNQGEDERPTS